MLFHDASGLPIAVLGRVSGSGNVQEHRLDVAVRKARWSRSPTNHPHRTIVPGTRVFFPDFLLRARVISYPKPSLTKNNRYTPKLDDFDALANGGSGTLI